MAAFSYIAQELCSFWDNYGWHCPAILLLSWTGYFLLILAYRLTFHPLAKFPGPKIAAATHAYEFWFDVVRWGRYTHEIRRMHERYGECVLVDLLYESIRMSFIAAILNSLILFMHLDTAKLISPVILFLPSLQGVGTVDHDQHRLRRGAINNFFSRSQIYRLESLINENAQRLCDRLLDLRDQKPIRVVDPYSCFSSDVITEYCFGESFEYLSQPTWEPNYRTALNILFGYIHIFRHFPFLGYLIEIIPLARSIVSRISRNAGLVMKDLKPVIVAQCVSPRQVIIPEKIRRTESISTTINGTSQTTILSSLMASNLPPSEKTIERLSAEANVLLIGGTQSTSVTLELATYHLLANPLIAERLRSELSAAVPDPKRLPAWKDLEKLPYFTAVILETLRLVYGAPGRLPRIATDQDLFYSGTWVSPRSHDKVKVSHVIPKGHAIGMSAFIIHMDETIFPNAATFKPERWLDEMGKVNRGLERYLLSFSRGSRNCIGMQLAYCELYVCIAALQLRVLPKMRLYETNDLDVQYDHDELVGKPRSDSQGVRVLIV
ncbi:unnamed protein product [Clonostachys byssicola]|uniref:Trichodiene oxygenase n=1 Tax=Clonostachys byssicola TaxID=160290 RepID=A0A9N9XUC8_9HYPO|nr:unnamed protein product [Clonostachys byssicola]